MSFTRQPHAVKTAIALPRDTFLQAEKLAKELKLTRSGLFREALEHLLRERIPAASANKVAPIYSKLAKENRKLAEEYLPLAKESWPKD